MQPHFKYLFFMTFPVIKDRHNYLDKEGLKLCFKIEGNSRVQILKIGNASLGVLGIICTPTHFYLMKGTHKESVF